MFGVRKGVWRLRIDKYLKVSRIIKRRTVATDACSAGRVEINGKIAKPSSEVKSGDIIRIRFGDRLIKVEVNDVRDVVRKEDASGMYSIIENENPSSE